MRSPILEAQGIAIGYAGARPPSVTVAQGIDVRLLAGEMVCLIGPNGAGKSTLMRTLAGMQPPLTGTITINGTPLAALTANARARSLGVVLTERPNVGMLSGYGLVALGRHPYTDWTGRLSPHDEAVIRWAVEAVGAQDIAARPVMELSDGQRQKLMIARALAQEPQVILLDEPTAFLDLPRRVEIMQLLQRLAHETGRTVLLSTHELDLALRTADRIWLLSGGVLASGAPEDLVLSGAFETAFRSEGVIFDRHTGAFKVNAEGVGKIYVRNMGEDGVAAVWTRRALERAGFAISPDADSATITVQILERMGGTIWRLQAGELASEHRSLQGLIASLTSEI